MFDLLLVVFLFIAAGAGYLGGGFKELVKIGSLLVLIGLYSLPSVKSGIIGVTGPHFSYIAILGSFVFFYFILQKLLIWVLSSLVTHREGALGALNKMTGVLFGAIKALAVFLFVTALILFMWEKNILVEIKDMMNHSIFFKFLSFIVRQIT